MAASLPNDLLQEQNIAQRNKSWRRNIKSDTSIANDQIKTIESLSVSSASSSSESLISVISADTDEDISTLSTDSASTKKESETSSDLNLLLAHTIFGDYVRKHEIPRKVFHSSIGFVTLYLYTIGVQIQSFPTWFHVSFIMILSIDFLRFSSSKINHLYCHLLGFLMREKEVKSYNGVLWYILGLDFAFSFFSKDIAVLSVLLLSWSDTAASTCGRAWGYLTPKIARNKSLAGSLAAFVVGVISSYLFYGFFVPNWSQYNAPGSIYWTPETSYLNINTLSLLAGFVAALSEGIDVFNWDDNFTIPVFSSIFFYIVITIFHK